MQRTKSSKRGFPRKPQSSCQIWQSDSQGCSAGRGTAASRGVEVMEGHGFVGPRSARENRYSLRRIQNATQYLESQLISHDYLGSRVQMAGAEYDPATHRADIQFEVTPGARAHVNVEGAHLWGRYAKEVAADLSNRRPRSRADSGKPGESYLTFSVEGLFRRCRAVRCSARTKWPNHSFPHY